MIEHMYKQNKNILMTWPSNVASLEVYSLAASEPNKPRNFLWSADVNINASLHLVILFKSMATANKMLSWCCTHRHLRKIGCLMAHTACLVCLISTVSGRSKKSLKCGISSGHITNLKQSIFSFQYLWLYQSKNKTKTFPCILAIDI